MTSAFPEFHLWTLTQSIRDEPVSSHLDESSIAYGVLIAPGLVAQRRDSVYREAARELV